MQKIFNITQDFKHYIVYFLGIKIRFSKKGYGKFKIPTELAGHPILVESSANECVYDTLSENKPCFITRFGCIEIEAVDYYLQYKNSDGQCVFPDYIKDNMRNQTVFFTPTDELLSKYCQETVDMIKNIDILGVINCYGKNNSSEEPLIKKYASPNIKLIHLSWIMQETFKEKKPWTRILEGKKVLIIHPFEKSIINQYPKGEKLFQNPLIFPKFKLETIKAVQGIDTDSSKNQYKDWFEALEYMYREIDKKDFDIALIAAGAFGMFLANYIKQKGKQAVHAGGALQLLFGIKGERWNKPGYENILYNEYWTSPLKEECPSDLDNFLKGEKIKAYW